MASSNKTPHYRLNQWRLTDAPERADFVADNHTMENALHGGLAQADAAMASLETVNYRDTHTAGLMADLLFLEQMGEACRLEALEEAQKDTALRERLNGHTENQVNPHRVRAEQAGAVPEAWIGERTRTDGYFAQGEAVKGMPCGAYSAALSPDGQAIAVGLTNAPRIGLLEENSAGQFEYVSVAWPTQPARTVYSLAWSPDGRFLAACGGGNPGVIIYRMRDNRPAETVYTASSTNSVYDCKFSPDGKYFFTCCSHVSVGFQLYSFDDGSLVEIAVPDDLITGYGCYSADWSPDGSLLAITNYQQFAGIIGLQLYSFDQGTCSLKFSEPIGHSKLSRVRFSPDGRYLAVGINMSGGGRPADLYLIEEDFTLSPCQIQDALYGYGKAKSIAWSPDSRYVAITRDSLYPSNYIFLYRKVHDGFQFESVGLDTTKPIQSYYEVVFDATGELLLATDPSSGAQVFDLHTPSTGVAGLDTGGKVPLEQFSDKVVTVRNIRPILEELGLL